MKVWMKWAVAVAGAWSGTGILAAEPESTIEPLASGAFRFDWPGEADMTYFIQWSETLGDWSYFPVIEHGEDHDLFEFMTDAPRFFVRVVSWPYTGSDPHSADFDGDGLSNLFELMNGFDPLNEDTDGDPDQDGALNTTEQQTGRDPRVKDNPAVKLNVTVGN